MNKWGKTVGAAALAAILCGAGTAQALSPRQAACYEQVTAAQARYDLAEIYEFIGSDFVGGFTFATLVDFDGDGIEEMVCSYYDHKGADSEPKQQVWTYQNGKAVLLFEHQITNFANDVSPEVVLYVDPQKAYLATGQALMNGGEAVYWTKQGEQWVAVLRCVDSPDSSWITINGESVTSDDPDATMAAFTQGMEQRWFGFLYDQSKILAEQNKTLQMLAQAARPIAAPSSAALRINGAPVSAPAYLIAGSNYFRLRDLATLISGTEKQFAIDWNSEQNCISLTKGMLYVGDVTTAPTRIMQASACMSNFVLDNVPLELAAYTIGGNNYVKLRDLAQALNFSVSWDAGEGSVTIDTSRGYTAQ